MCEKNHPFRLFFSSLYFPGEGGAMDEETLGQRLAFIRGKRGLSQPDVAKLTGLKVQNISRLETKAREHVRSDTLARLAQALECSTDYLLGLSDEPAPPKKRPRASKHEPVG